MVSLKRAFFFMLVVKIWENAFDSVFVAGVDTVGGVRVPSAYCGTIGFRSSYGAVSHAGIIPLSTSLDAVGNGKLRAILFVYKEINNACLEYSFRRYIHSKCFCFLISLDATSFLKKDIL